MTFATLLATTGFDAQPQAPADTCHDGQPAVGWSWNGERWVPACGQHISPAPARRIFNSEYLEDS